jgi:hypothetical protein
MLQRAKKRVCNLHGSATRSRATGWLMTTRPANSLARSILSAVADEYLNNLHQH